MGKRQGSLSELAGAPPKLATTADLDLPGVQPTRTHTISRSANNSPSPHKINLRAVAEALVEEGLDPAVELARVLKGRIKTDDNGDPVIDPATGEPVRVYAIDEDVRVRTLNEILQYTQPKLKAVEVKMSGTLDMSNEQLDQRLQSLLAKAVK